MSSSARFWALSLYITPLKFMWHLGGRIHDRKGQVILPIPSWVSSRFLSYVNLQQLAQKTNLIPIPGNFRILERGLKTVDPKNFREF
jgi:hypothetical protein